jgi:hypothetical protein
MPTIRLKPNSPEFLDDTPNVSIKTCDMPGCSQHAQFKAPKDKTLADHYVFCQEHIKEYNRAWNYFADLDEQELEQHWQDTLYGHRPTRKFGIGAEFIDELYRKTWQTYHFTVQEPPKTHHRQDRSYEVPYQANAPEQEALEIMSLSPPITLEDIKARYKTLAKKYHPDFNPGDKDAEEQLKKINMAYTILKVAFEKFEKLPERP